MAAKQKTSLPPLLKWPGGKRHLANKLVRMLPEHDTYVEPFAGGAAVFFRKPMVRRNILGDNDPWLIDFYKKVRNGGLAKCAGGIRKSRDLFRRVKTNDRSACKMLAKTVLSWHGNRLSFVGDKGTPERRVMLKSRLKNHKSYQKKLRGAYVRKSDFATTMRKFDGVKTVHFLDPPWTLDYSDKTYHGGKKAYVKANLGKGGKGTAFDPAHIKKICDRMKGYVFIIINNDPEIRRIYCKDPKWRCRTIVSHTNRGGRAVRGKRAHANVRNLILIKGFGAKRSRKRM